MGDRWTAQKLGCLDQIVVDRRSTHLDFRIAYYIAHRMDRVPAKPAFASPTSLRRFR